MNNAKRTVKQRAFEGMMEYLLIFFVSWGRIVPFYGL